MTDPRLPAGHVQVYTGDGKGKTTAAVGLATRAAGAGLRVFFGQFIKAGDSSETRALRRFDGLVVVEAFGPDAFVVDGPTDAERAVARAGLDTARTALVSADYDVVVLDEINCAVACGLLSEEDVVDLIAERPERVELVLTGRGARPRVVAAADLVTEMRAVRHYFDAGVRARDGIER